MPKSYLFVSARVTSPRDFGAVISLCNAAAQIMDGVGLFCYEPLSPEFPTTYRVPALPSMSGMDIGQVLYRACQDL
jgi:hypothetical protein